MTSTKTSEMQAVRVCKWAMRHTHATYTRGDVAGIFVSTEMKRQYPYTRRCSGNTHARRHVAIAMVPSTNRCYKKARENSDNRDNAEARGVEKNRLNVLSRIEHTVYPRFATDGLARNVKSWVYLYPRDMREWSQHSLRTVNLNDMVM